MHKQINIGLISDGPNLIEQDIYRSLKDVFKIHKVFSSGESIPACDIYIVAVAKAEQILVQDLRSKISEAHDLLVVSGEQEDLALDRENKVFMYPYKYDVITNFPLIIETVYNAGKLRMEA